MVVARVVAKLEPGGAQLSLLRAARALAARGYRCRLLVGFATESGIAMARDHGLEPELMGAPEDLQWRCDPAFAEWLKPRLTGVDIVHAHMLGAWWAAVLVMGAGVLESALRARIAETKLQRVVHLCGWVPNPASWVAGASAQVCPSREEAFSQAAILAMALGVPVIGTRVDGFPQTLREGRGLMVEPDDAHALAAMLKGVLSGRRTTDLAGARAWAQQFDVERVASLYQRDYLELCRASAGAIAA